MSAFQLFLQLFIETLEQNRLVPEAAQASRSDSPWLIRPVDIRAGEIRANGGCGLLLLYQFDGMPITGIVGALVSNREKIRGRGTRD